MMSLDILQLKYRDSNFTATLDARLAWEDQVSREIEARVAEIVRGVRQRGDAALLDYTREFDGYSVAGSAALELPQQRLQQALAAIPAAQLAALEAAAERIRSYHSRWRASRKLSWWCRHRPVS